MSNNVQKIKRPIIHSVKTLAKTRVFECQQVELQFANGNIVNYECLLGSEAVLVIPVMKDHVKLIKEYAVGAQRYLLGFVKGRLNEGENIEDAANRELQEEIGYAANKLQYVRTVAVAPGYTNFKTHIVIASDLYASKLQGDEPESIEVCEIKVNELDELFKREDFIESRSQLAVYILKEWIEGKISA